MCYYNCSSGSPIYEVPAKSYTGERILEILLDENIDMKKVCCEQPTQIAKSSTFVVNLNSLKQPDDVKKDEFGKWCYSGSHSQVYQAWKTDDDDREYEIVGKTDSSEIHSFLEELIANILQIQNYNVF